MMPRFTLTPFPQAGRQGGHSFNGNGANNLMKTGTLKFNGGHLAYTETTGDGPAVLLIHGNSGARGVWAAQLESDLGRRHRMVALDLPSHGDSSPLSGGDDALTELAQAVVAAAESLGMADAVFVGHSLGGHLLLEAAGAGLIPRARGLLIHGAPPLSGPADFGQAFHPNPVAMAAFTADPTEPEIDALLAAWFSPRGAAPAWAKRDFVRAHPPIRAQIGAALMSGRMLDERRVVAELEIPLAILNGGDDPLMNTAWLDALVAPTLWRAEVQVVPKAGHFAQSDHPAAFNTLFEAFVGEVTAG